MTSKEWKPINNINCKNMKKKCCWQPKKLQNHIASATKNKPLYSPKKAFNIFEGALYIYFGSRKD